MNNRDRRVKRVVALIEGRNVLSRSTIVTAA